MKFNNMKLAVAFCIVFLSNVFCTSAFAEASVSMAFVDVNILQQQFLAEINEKLTAEFKTEQAELQRDLDKFNKEQEGFTKNAKTMSKTQATTKQGELNIRKLELQQQLQQFDQKVAVRKQEELQVKLDGLFKAVEDVSKGKYDMVLAKNATLFVTGKYDITEQVVAKYKKSYSKK